MTRPFSPGQKVRHRTGDYGVVLSADETTVTVKDHTGAERRWLVKHTEPQK